VIAAGRDRATDAVRALAVTGVVLGHWLVTAIVPLGADGWQVASPLSAVSWLTPATWLLQTLGLFFFVAGYAAARSASAANDRGEPYARWAGTRLRRLAGSLLTVLGPWLAALAVAAAAGVPYPTLNTVVVLLISPLWFLLPLAVLTIAVRPIRRAAMRWGPAAMLPAVGVVAVSDAGIGLAPVTVVSAWLVPYLFGTLAAAGRLARRTGWCLLAGGTIVIAVLVLFAGYPAAAVGVPGAGKSNLNPPSLVAVALAVAQVGLVQLIRGRLERVAAAPAVWRAVGAVNRYAMPIFLWHQSALVAVTAAGLWLAGGAALPGLHTPPSDAGWVLARLPWLPVFAATLAVMAGTRPGGWGTIVGVCWPRRAKEVIAVRDSDPSSRGRAIDPPR
jgi:fucose 4-O-acetylase-like acetyltransferase